MRSRNDQRELLGEFDKLGPEQQARVVFVRCLAHKAGQAENSGAERGARPVEAVLVELADEVPEEQWNKLPDNLTENLDHYLYGTPKR